MFFSSKFYLPRYDRLLVLQVDFFTSFHWLEPKNNNTVLVNMSNYLIHYEKV